MRHLLEVLLGLFQRSGSSSSIFLAGWVEILRILPSVLVMEL